MTKEERDEVTALLESAISSTRQLIEEYKIDTRPIAPDDSIGRVSRMDAINNRSVVEAALRVQENKLSGLLRVQSNLNTDDFGLCAKCHQPIPIQRILLVPHNRFCVRCAS